MRITVLRYKDSGKETMGLLFIDGVFRCFTLEDTHREVKIKHETRIPNGLYNLGIKKYGKFYEASFDKFSEEYHKGVIQVLDVPNFSEILIHWGNKNSDTSGCLLVGELATPNSIGNSVKAYKDIYTDIIAELEVGNLCEIEYKDLIV